MGVQFCGLKHSVDVCPHRNVASVETLEDKTSNQIRWSPRGRHVVLATVGSSAKSGVDFYDVDFYADDVGRREVPKEDRVVQIGHGDHYGVTDVDWDPSGRYLATSASSWRPTVSEAERKLLMLI